MSDLFLRAEIDARQTFYGIDRPRIRARIRRLGDLVRPQLRSLVEEAFDLALEQESEGEKA